MNSCDHPWFEFQIILAKLNKKQLHTKRSNLKWNYSTDLDLWKIDFLIHFHIFIYSAVWIAICFKLKLPFEVEVCWTLCTFIRISFMITRIEIRNAKKCFCWWYTFVSRSISLFLLLLRKTIILNILGWNEEDFYLALLQYYMKKKKNEISVFYIIFHI